MVTISIGKTIYTARGHFKTQGLALSDKLLRNMEKELENEHDFCYNGINKSQNSLDCKPNAGRHSERSTV
jgi:hypothetical protein